MTGAPSRAALVAAAGCLLAACGGTSPDASPSTAATATPAARPAATGKVAIMLTPAGCEPARISAAAGRLTFAVVNEGADAISEFEMAKRLYAPARQPYEAIEPVAESFGDLDPSIDARDGDLPEGTPWTGFRRIEQALWTTHRLRGMPALTTQLRRDVRRLAQLVRTEPLQPVQIANGAAELLNEVGTSKITGEEDRYSHTDLWDFDANVDGSRAAIAALRPLLAKRDGTLATTIDEQFEAVDRALDKHRSGQGFASYTSLTPTDTRTLASAVDALAESVSKVAPLVNG